MAEQISELIVKYGLETVCIALLINFFTAVTKLPIKYFANKTKHGAQITRFIVFLPVIFGFAFSSLYAKFVAKDFAFGKEFLTLWLTSSSLSLTFYAVFEKLMPPKSGTTAEEAEAERQAIEKLENVLNKGQKNDDTNVNKADEAATEATDVAASEKIVLRGNKNENSETEEK